ncbi:hypothetical protein [Alterisphingorhabdus coralli]|uniref:Uncharacterized protein n=1 Tax=Alterisphingorhabdus coralli TaxID=3071408 RepID=A0AA97I2Q3_9SPHN|nr:hypothetical protein [Parasphingorhabdus sp. SCSIO 66989]WOE75965.1 hypothetical protein RB602_04405 [Parasphingorhabdus sp. SCSIO 66989]
MRDALLKMLILVPVALCYASVAHGQGTDGVSAVNEQSPDEISSTNKVSQFWSDYRAQGEEAAETIFNISKPDPATRLLETGPVDPDWNSRGFDIEGYLNGLPGGVAANAVYDVDEASPGLTFFDGLPDVLLSGWEMLQKGPLYDPEGNSVALSPISKNHIVAISGSDSQDNGTAKCTNFRINNLSKRVAVFRNQSTLFDSNDRDSVIKETEAIVMANLVVKTMQSLGSVICEVHRRKNDGTIFSRVYNLEGELFVNQGVDEKRVISVSDIDVSELLTQNFVSPIEGFITASAITPSQD